MAIGNIELTPQLVQAVRDAVDIVAVASEHTRLRKAGKRYSGLCPLHKEKTPSFSVDPVRGLFYCFGCGQGGDAIKLYMLTCGEEFPAAIESLAHRYGIPVTVRRRRGGGEREDPREIEGALEAAAEFFNHQLKKGGEARRYLERRQIGPELIERFGLGYAPDGWRNLVDAVGRRVPVATLEAAGLIARSQRRDGELYDRFRNRLMFPIRAASGRLVGFGGRALGDDRAKYLNTSETESFHKGRLLYGLDVARRSVREKGRALLVEGYFDVLGAVASGIDWCVASMGTALTPEQARLLARYGDEVVVGYDGDEAGERAFRRALPLLLAEGLTVSRASFGEGHDPDSLRLASGTEAVLRAVEGAEDAVDRELGRLIPVAARREPRIQARAAAAVVELLQPIKDAVLRWGYSRRAAERLGVPVDLLWRRLGGGAPTPPAAERVHRSVSPVRSLEERILHLLLAGADEEKLPPAAELPPPEAFLDPVCRNIFQAFCDLYTGEREPPSVKGVLSRLAEQRPAVDRIAKLLLEEPSASAAGAFEVSLAQLKRRWQQQRLRELATRITEAQREGDRRRLERLLEEKTSLSHALHRGSGERLNEE